MVFAKVGECWFCPLGGILDCITRSSLAISVKLGLSDGSADQHLSMSDFQSRSQDSGTGGRKVLLTIPPALDSVVNTRVCLLVIWKIFGWKLKKECVEVVTDYSPIMQFGIWFFSGKKFPQYNPKGEYVNLQTRPEVCVNTQG